MSDKTRRERDRERRWKDIALRQRDESMAAVEDLEERLAKQIECRCSCGKLMGHRIKRREGCSSSPGQGDELDRARATSAQSYWEREYRRAIQERDLARREVSARKEDEVALSGEVVRLREEVKAAIEERDFWDRERDKAGLECFDLGERLAKAEQACKGLREERDLARSQVEELNDNLAEFLD